jgi:hypothetical protein
MKENMKKLILITGPQGSGNHLYSKLLALHKDVWGWKELNETFWIGHDQEPFNKFWVSPELWASTDFGDYQYAFASISVPYVQNGVTVVPDFDTFIKGAESAGWTVQLVIIGRDVNILEAQQQRLRKKVTLPNMLNALDKLVEQYNPVYISHELVCLYGANYLKSLGKLLDFPIDYSNPLVAEILKENSNKKYIKYLEEVELDKLVTKILASTATEGTEWYQRGETIK